MMVLKCKSLNELSNFQYHDAEIKKIVISGKNMFWNVSAINATTNNTQNKNPKDMCVEAAIMKFENIIVDSIVFSAYIVSDSNGNTIKEVNAEAAKPDDYIEIITKSTDSYCYIDGMDSIEQKPDGTYLVCFNIFSEPGYYHLTFSFSLSVVEWDNFSGEAWYEHPKWKKQ